MTILVTGGAGYIGSHMVYALVDRGEEVVVLDNLSTGFDWAVAPQAELVVGDIGDGAALSRIFGAHEITAIVHFAGSIIVPESVENPLKYYHNNTCKSRTLLEAAVAAGVPHFIFSSTAAVYGIPERNPAFEDAPTAPINPYGRSKLMTEWTLRDVAAAYPMRYVALRYFNVAGADPAGRTGQSTPEATHLIKVACQTALGMREKMLVFGTDYDTPDGTCIRDYIHVSDLIAAHVDALEYLRGGGESAVFNCGYGHGYSVLEVIDTVKRVTGIDFLVEHAPRRAGDPPMLVAGAARIRDELGWRPQLDDLTEIVRSAYAWERHLLERNAS
ncbi:MAG TPA: UDP-glucose 4-epimerase GalE [Thermopetrobacter sp.]|nr:UDP-glucose 4-epimerase GalE [Thermopetrobacter sp.]